MHRAMRMKVRELNPHVLCVLCGGYLVDATTIVECLHSFCRTCIVHYLHTSNYCPVCECLVHKKNPQLNIRSDRVLQDIVYKIVPDLFKDEMRRRREFYNVPESIDIPNGCSGALRESDRYIYSQDERISLCLEFCPRGRPNEDDYDNKLVLKKQLQDKRYLLCPAVMTIHHLKKFLRLKFSLSDRLEIEVFKTDEVLFDDYTLVDIAYITEWRRENVMKLNYAIYENTSKRQKREKSPVAVSPGNEDSGIEDENASHDTSVHDMEMSDAGVNTMPIDTGAESQVKEKSSSNEDYNDSVVQTSPYEGSGLDTDDLWTDEVIDLSKPKQRNPIAPIEESEITEDGNIEEDGEQKYTYMVDGFTEGDTSMENGYINTENSITDLNSNTENGSLNLVTSTMKNDVSHSQTNGRNHTENPGTSQTGQSTVTEKQCDSDTPKKRKLSEGHNKQHGEATAKSPKCTEVCNGHTVKPRNEKLVVKLSKERDSENYTATMS